MKWLLLLACWVLLGCGVIYGLVTGIVPHLLTPALFPQGQAREVKRDPVENTITTAAFAVGDGVTRQKSQLAAR